jgi:hypothetical protein
MQFIRRIQRMGKLFRVFRPLVVLDYELSLAQRTQNLQRGAGRKKPEIMPASRKSPKWTVNCEL